MLQQFIERPVLSTVISILFVLLGVIALMNLPVQQYPDIAPPTIEVKAMYPGANADVMLNAVVAPLEEKINGVEGMTYMTSSANNDGSASIQVFFTLETDPDMAAVNVQNRVSAASSSLPAEVVKMGVTTNKKQNSMIMALSLSSDNPAHDETFIQNYARIFVTPELQRVNGVGDVTIFGARDFSMRIWLHPEKLAAYKLNPTDVAAALAEQNLEVAPGKLGAESMQAFQYTIKYKGRLSDVADYENIIIRVSDLGEVLHLRDIADIEFGAFRYDIVGTAEGKPGAIMAIYQMKGSNSQEICNTVKAKIAKIKENLPSGMKIQFVMDSQDFLDASISSVVKTLFEAFILVFIVVFIFLQNLKATIIPAISATVAIVGTFLFLSLFGFTINLLTLFALVLSIGIVVDDAIVVVEAVYAKLEADPNITTMEATKSAMGDITGAVISITLVFMATFIPVTFMSGASGAFYQQFGITLAVAVGISAINALTLSPALCAIMIKLEHHKEGEKKSLPKRMGDSFNAAFGAMTNKYGGLLTSLANKRFLTMLVFVGILGVSVYFLNTTPTAFVPTEDQGMIFYDVTMPEGTASERTQEILLQVDSMIRAIPEVETSVTVAGTSMISGAVGGAYGLGMVRLVNWSQRDPKSLKNTVMSLYRMTAENISKDAQILYFVPPTISGYGNSDAIELQFLDQTGSGDLINMHTVGNEFMAQLRERPEIGNIMCNFSVTVPQFEMILDVEKTKRMGLSVKDVFNTMQYYYGGMVAGDFNRFTRYYRVMIQAHPNARANEQSLNQIFVRNKHNEMVPLSSVIELKRVFGSDLVKRYNMFNAMTMNIAPAAGFSSGQVMQIIAEVAKDLPTGFVYEYSGMTRDEIESGGQQAFIFALSFLLIFFILSALYESYIVPLSVMLSLLFAVFGAYAVVNILGLPANIYVQVAMIMLLGLLAKNSILIVEFAKMKREEGMEIKDAAILAAKERIRPILMTSFAFICGMIPLCLASGAGAMGNISIGFAAGGGFLISTVLGLLFVPIFFTLFQQLQEKIGKKP